MQGCNYMVACLCQECQDKPIFATKQGGRLLSVEEFFEHATGRTVSSAGGKAGGWGQAITVHEGPAKEVSCAWVPPHCSYPSLTLFSDIPARCNIRIVLGRLVCLSRSGCLIAPANSTTTSANGSSSRVAAGGRTLRIHAPPSSKGGAQLCFTGSALEPARPCWFVRVPHP